MTRDTRFLPISRYRPPEYAAAADTQDEALDALFDCIGVGARTLVDVGIGDTSHEGPAHRSYFAGGGWRGLAVEHTRRSQELLAQIYVDNPGVEVQCRALEFPENAGLLDALIAVRFT
jgi:hypothetical protein